MGGRFAVSDVVVRGGRRALRAPRPQADRGCEVLLWTDVLLVTNPPVATANLPVGLVMTLLGESEPAACRPGVWIRIQSCPVVRSASGGKATKPCAGPPLTIEYWPTTTPPELTPKANVVNATVCIGAPAQPSSFSHVKSS